MKYCKMKDKYYKEGRDVDHGEDNDWYYEFNTVEELKEKWKRNPVNWAILQVGKLFGLKE